MKRKGGRFPTELHSRHYQVILVDSITGEVLHRELHMHLKSACRWVREWEKRPEGIVAIIWPESERPLIRVKVR